MPVLTSGLVSVSFRAMTPREIVALCVQGGLKAIEWGGDIHVPAGNLVQAQTVGQMTRDAGLRVACYGSYCRMTKEERMQFGALIETAKSLQAPLIRVWAGQMGSAQATAAYRAQIADSLRMLGEYAEQAGIEVALEYHSHTLTDTAQSACALLKEVDHPHVGTLWQPPIGMDAAACAADLTSVLPYLRNLHVYSWTGMERQALEKGAGKWRKCLDILNTLAEDRSCLLEFVRDDDPRQLIDDAKCLNRWLEGEWRFQPAGECGDEQR